MIDSLHNQQLIYYLKSTQEAQEATRDQELITQIGFFGYHVRPFDSLNELEQSMSHEIPAGLILNWDFSREEALQTKEKEDLACSFARVQQETLETPGILFLSNQDDVAARLQSVRMGGQAFFVKPVDSGTVIDTLDRLLKKEKMLPYRVLIVDDSVVAARFAQATLQKAGMIAEVVARPLTVTTAVQEFNPDIILLDMYMPECTGIELARVIRQMESFVSIPIVYLSSEEDKDMQLEAMSIGADDFINKMDLKRHHLIGAVQSRVERYRKLRLMMNRDGLTGLLNHTTVSERIISEIARVKRAQAAGKETHVAVAMLDIDHLKAVNDTYGHTTGDRVLRNLSRFLQQRLRQSDSIGRYGGEEFAVLLPETDGPNAVRLMNEIRDHFSQVRHQTEQGEFSVTFSCGVATFPEFSEAVKITEAVEQAMYSAKRAGRNRVMLAE